MINHTALGRAFTVRILGVVDYTNYLRIYREIIVIRIINVAFDYLFYNIARHRDVFCGKIYRTKI